MIDDGLRKMASAFWARLITDAVNAEAIRRGWPVDWATSRAPAKVRAEETLNGIRRWLSSEDDDEIRHALSSLANVSVRHVIETIRRIPDLDDAALRRARAEVARCLAAHRVPASSAEPRLMTSVGDAATTPRRIAREIRRRSGRRRQSEDTAGTTGSGANGC